MTQTIKMETTVKAVRHVDVREKEQLYIIVEKGEKRIVINVGEKTYKAIKELTEETVEDE